MGPTGLCAFIVLFELIVLLMQHVTLTLNLFLMPCNSSDQNPPLAELYRGIFEEKYPQSKQAYDYFEFRTFEVAEYDLQLI